MKLPDLPVNDVLPRLAKVLQNNANAVLVAPPGAGKTTLVPLALLDAPWREGRRIIVLAPRRIAARAAAKRMAALLGETVGETVGYRVRMETRVSDRTRIEVVTEGVFTRMIQDDAELSGIAVVIFDEFHERSLDADFGLALAIDVQQALREDLRILVMSATIDGAKIAGLISGQIVESAGRSYPVDIIYHQRPGDVRLEQFVANEVRWALAQEKGDILVFLPGQREIERVREQLETRIPQNVEIAPLYGAMGVSSQDRAIQPALGGKRKVVLATSIAETSLTIEGITIVIDCGLARLPRYEPANGLTRLETVRASKASIDQRAGRAGRTAPGTAIRLWRKEQTASLPNHAPPEILSADLSHLTLDLAAWGVDDPSTLVWQDLPPAPAMHEAKLMLGKIDAIDKQGGLTSHGKALRSLSLPPRSANMLVLASSYGCLESAALLSIVLSERGLGGNSTDLQQRWEQADWEKGNRAKAARQLAKRLVKNTRDLDLRSDRSNEDLSIGAVLSFAWPDRIAIRTGQSSSGAVRYRLANGSGGEIEAEHQLARQPWLVVAELAGRAGAARILSAAAISFSEVEQLHHKLIVTKNIVEFDAASGKVKSKAVRKLGALALSKVVISNPPADLVEAALVSGIKNNGLDLLQWSDADNSLRCRLQFLHRVDPDNWPDVSNDGLAVRLDDWFLPIIAGKSAIGEISPALLDAGLKMLVSYNQHYSIDSLAPVQIKLENSQSFQLRYEAEDVVLSARAQKIYGLKQHPAIFEAKIPVLVEILSPAGRPVQITRDIPGFWLGSWSDVRSDMRGRYPRHYWPEDPANADSNIKPNRRRSRK